MRRGVASFSMASFSVGSSLVGSVLALGSASTAWAAAPDDPVVIEARPADAEGEPDDRVTFVAGPEADDEPLRIVGPVEGPAAEGEPGGAVEVSTRQEVVVHEAAPTPVWWLGLQSNVALSPIPASGRVGREERLLDANRFRACLQPYEGRTCGVVKGFDFRIQLFQAAGTHDRPRVIGYLRTGYGAGRVSVEPRDDGRRAGDATAVQYLAVPIFVGASAYAFPRSPVRPYGGLGVGVEILRLDYARFEQARLTDVTVRPGFELHAGVEGRITNHIALHASVMQHWSTRRRLIGVPDVSTTGLAILLGVTVAVPTQPLRRPGGGTTVVQQSTRTVVR
jgi:opacity protein-like surface antigen